MAAIGFVAAVRVVVLICVVLLFPMLGVAAGCCRVVRIRRCFLGVGLLAKIIWPWRLEVALVWRVLDLCCRLRSELVIIDPWL